MNNFDACRGITRRHFWEDYRSPLTCVDYPIFSASASGETTDILVEGIYRAAGPVLEGIEFGGEVSLSWSQVPNAYAYIVYRADSISSPFMALVSGVLDQVWVDVPATPGTFYYRVTAIEPDFGETEVSNVVALTV
jgi:fibronectin type 3 domain-containing protein